VTTQAVIASEAKQSPIREMGIASAEERRLAMTRAEQLRPILQSEAFKWINKQ
jgi:hypothetical protein